EIINRIFEPYFTTKNEKEGIGIGLYLVEDILENKLNGNISVKNIEFKHENIDYIGAEFRISIKLKIPK
ncbi:MAG: HAMP domain-containing histidine kinase, partial [Campylobacteraceae bacterium]|nr:HAMP domain-containing histidine kinase [Campylobacteraceae bacterium]